AIAENNNPASVLEFGRREDNVRMIVIVSSCKGFVVAGIALAAGDLRVLAHLARNATRRGILRETLRCSESPPPCVRRLVPTGHFEMGQIPEVSVWGGCGH